VKGGKGARAEGRRKPTGRKKGHAETGRTRTARREATQLTAIFTRPHFCSKQTHRKEMKTRQKKRKKNKQ